MDFVSHFSDEETESHQNKIICSRSQSVSAGWGIQAPIYMWQVNTLVPSLLQNVGGQRSPGGIYGEDHQKSSLYTSKVTLLVHWETIIWTDVYLSQKYVHSPIIGIVCNLSGVAPDHGHSPLQLLLLYPTPCCEKCLPLINSHPVQQQRIHPKKHRIEKMWLWGF